VSGTVLGYRIEWRLRDVMKARGISSAIELHRRLKAVDPDSINHVQLTKLVKKAPARISLRVLLGLVIVLDCEVNDLLRAREGMEGDQTNRSDI